MKKRNVFAACRLPAMIFAMMAVILLAGCSKGDGNSTNPGGGGNTVFKSSDFEVYNVMVKANNDKTSVRTEFNVKNKTTKTYVPNAVNGEFMVYIKMKASDGAWYDYKYILNSNINAGASVTSIYTFGVPAQGMTLDPNTFAYEVKYRD